MRASSSLLDFAQANLWDFVLASAEAMVCGDTAS
jgi:hypothetical protein